MITVFNCHTPARLLGFGGTEEFTTCVSLKIGSCWEAAGGTLWLEIVQTASVAKQESIDARPCVVSSPGLKTFSPEACEIRVNEYLAGDSYLRCGVCGRHD